MRAWIFVSAAHEPLAPNVTPHHCCVIEYRAPSRVAFVMTSQDPNTRPNSNVRNTRTSRRGVSNASSSANCPRSFLMAAQHRGAGHSPRRNDLPLPPCPYVETLRRVLLADPRADLIDRAVQDAL